MTPTTMTLITFEHARFGDWIVKLSYNQNWDTFLIIASNKLKSECIVKLFTSEIEVVNFVSFLGEKYE